MNVDFAIIGGSFAGLSAALQLARARRDVLVVDAGQRRNRFVDEAGGHSHGFLTRDGQPPGAIAAEGRSQLLRYPTVQWLDGLAEEAQRGSDGRFAFRVAGKEVRAGRLILAIGVRDELPPVPGLAERWGRSLFHCPYCHGYELGAGPIGIVAASPMAQHHGLMLPDWGETTLFLNDAYAPTQEDLAALVRKGTRIETTPIDRIEGAADVVLADGRVLSMNGLFTQTRAHLSSPVARQLGCEIAEGPLGEFIKVNAAQETSVAGVFACGDVARAAGSVALAVGDGALAGLAAHRSTLL